MSLPITPGTDGIRFEHRGALGVVVLDRPKALNALTWPMVRALSLQLAAWRLDPTVGAVLVKAVPGRAFCAGGDILAVAAALREQGVAAIVPFFRDEYRLNWRVGNFPKPYLALLDGIAMGGGVGISVHGSHRVVTERAEFAMPETGIGFFPDVGGTFFLPRCPGEVGTWLGLTGSRLDAAGCLEAGIGTHCVPGSRLAELEDRLAGEAVEALAPSVARHLADLAAAPPPSPLPLAEQRPAIDVCFRDSGLRAILDRLGAEPSGFGRAQLALLREKSPLAVAVALAQLRRGRSLDFSGAMRLEYRIVHRLLAAGDFAEGVRALLLDKDKTPRWRHARLEAVPDDEVEACFAPLAGGDLALDWEGL